MNTEVKRFPVVLCILDGLGLRPQKRGNAFKLAKTPNIDALKRQFPSATLTTHGSSVGLPEGQMGNSEVGHLNIGSGRIVKTMLPRIDEAIKTGELDKNKTLSQFLSVSKTNGGTIHIAGLFSEGGVHGHRDHLIKLMHIASSNKLKVNLHLFADGRDVETHSSIKDIKVIQSELPKNVRIASIMGRYYSMDRDKRWDRTEAAFWAITSGKGKRCKSALEAIINSHNNGLTDEFIEPTIIGNYNGLIDQNDRLIFTNFRADRARQLIYAFTEKNLVTSGHPVPNKFKDILGMIEYDPNLKKLVKAIFEKINIKDTLGECIEKNNLKQFRIAETEKYPHVTFFFNGGKESPFKDEIRIMCPSPKVATYDLKPEMSAFEIRDAIIPEINSNSSDFICLNFANPDMVGHTGNFNAAVKACETVDTCLREIVESSINNNYSIIIIADHGNSDVMKNNDGSPNTAHTTNPVPIIVIDSKTDKVNDGILADIAPTILNIMDIDIPEKMSGKILI